MDNGSLRYFFCVTEDGSLGIVGPLDQRFTLHCLVSQNRVHTQYVLSRLMVHSFSFAGHRCRLMLLCSLSGISVQSSSSLIIQPVQSLLPHVLLFGSFRLFCLEPCSSLFWHAPETSRFIRDLRCLTFGFTLVRLRSYLRTQSIFSSRLIVWFSRNLCISFNLVQSSL